MTNIPPEMKKRYEEAKMIKSDKKEQSETALDNAEDGIVRIGNAIINLRKAMISRDGKDYPLKAMEYKLLVYMLNNRNRVITKDEFFDKIWDTQFVGDVTLNVHIRHLREKLEDDPGKPAIIKTVWGVGFIFEA